MFRSLSTGLHPAVTTALKDGHHCFYVTFGEADFREGFCPAKKEWEGGKGGVKPSCLYSLPMALLLRGSNEKTGWEGSYGDADKILQEDRCR